MGREWRLHAPRAGAGVPTEMAAEVRVVTADAVWIMSDAGPALLSSVTGLAGPLTACLTPHEEMAEGHRVLLTREMSSEAPSRSAPVPDVATLGLPTVALGSEWLSAKVADLAPDSSLRIAQEIAGWGPGLTPSGDDVLIGYLLARRAVGGPSVEAEIDDLIDAMVSRTGEPSISLARWAGRAN